MEQCYFLLYCIFVACLLQCCSSSTGKVAEQTLQEMIRETCLEKTGYKPLDDNTTYFRVVEAATGSEVTLACSYCGESTEDLPRVWRWRQRALNNSEQEVQMGLAARPEDNHLYTYPNHSLVIRNVSTTDAGLYYCRSLVEEETAVFQFSVDLVQPEVAVVRQKAKTPWQKYHADHILPVNKRLYENTPPELEELLDKVKVRVESEWDPWLPCDGCTGLRRRYAKCRLRPKLNKVKYPDIVDGNLSENQTLLHQSVVVSCHSLDLHRWFPTMYSLTSVVPNFMQEENCFGDCQPEVRSAHDPRYHMQVQLFVGSSYSFVCPESDLRSKVFWKKDGVTMKPLGARKIKKPKKTLYKNPLKKKETNQYVIENVFVDRMNVLQLCMVTFKESGLYLCYVNNVPMKSFNVSVVTSSETERERFYHFWLLSLFTSTISTIIVIVGIAYNFFFRRDEFLQESDGYDSSEEEDEETRLLRENEKL